MTLTVLKFAVIIVIVRILVLRSFEILQ